METGRSHYYHTRSRRCSSSRHATRGRACGCPAQPATGGSNTSPCTGAHGSSPTATGAKSLPPFNLGGARARRVCSSSFELHRWRKRCRPVIEFNVGSGLWWLAGGSGPFAFAVTSLFDPPPLQTQCCAYMRSFCALQTDALTQRGASNATGNG